MMTPKQERFVEEYLVDLNAAAAARRAGYSPKWADRQANNLMVKNGEIRDAIRRGLEEKRKQVSVSAEYVIEQLIRGPTVRGFTPRLVERPENVNNVVDWPF